MNISGPQDAEGREMEAKAFTKLFGEAEPERLDFSKPPPRYEVGNQEDEEGCLVEGPVLPHRLFNHSRGAFVLWAWNDATSYDTGSCGDGDTRDEVLAAAWTHYKAHHDPPGLSAESFEDGASWVRGMAVLRRYDTFTEARAAAWAWYEARLATFNILRQRDYEAWPRCLTWSDTEHDEVKAWIVEATAFMELRRPDLPQMPAVLCG